ncbi:hypothetical protein [Belnapia sp. F-4-1]|uniref:hypothetical protein n=1 Tax=Belnapia sp. F-4-1 TaxID=1545443 RepID=UPI0005BD0327|nr:hypothetical protein [Belnapia sp. F-4-1]
MDNSLDSFPLVGAAIEAATAETQQFPPAAELHASVPPPSFVPLPADFASRPSPGPVDLSYPLPEPTRPAAPPPAAEIPCRSAPPAAERPYRPMPPPAEPLAPSDTLAALLNGVAQGVSRPSWPAPMPQACCPPAWSPSRLPR